MNEQYQTGAKTMDNLQQLFDMYDTSKDGRIQKDEAKVMMLDCLKAVGRLQGR